MVGWEANKSVGNCLQCAPGTSQDESCKDDHFEPPLTDNFEQDSESDSAEENEKLIVAGEKKAKRGRKVSWNEDQITDMVDVIVNEDELLNKLVFTNIKKARNTDVIKRCYHSGNVSVCKKVCLTMKTASGIATFIEEKEYGKWFDLLFPLVKTRDSCKPENACEPSACGRKVAGNDCGGSSDVIDEDDERSSTSSNDTDNNGNLPVKNKSIPVKTPTFKTGKSDQVGKAPELLQATIDNDPFTSMLC